MTDASNPQPPTLKRARLSNETELNKTPNAAGRLAASIGIVTLHPTLKRIAEFHLNKFMKLYTQQVKQEENIDKLNTTDFLPRSARFNFKLKASDVTAETKPFKDLATETDALVTSFSQAIKEKIKLTATLELQTTKTAIATHILESLTILAKGSILTITTESTISNEMILDVIKTVMCEPAIQDLVNVDTINAATYLYDLLPPTVYTQDQLQLLSQSDLQKNLQSTIVQTVIPTFKQSILHMYINSRNAFDQTNMANKQKLRMESFAKLTLFDNTATLATMELDKEHSVEPNHLSKLINDKVNKATLSMKKELAKLKEMKSPKNTSRGATDTTNTTVKPGKQPTNKTTKTPSRKNTDNRASQKKKKTIGHNNITIDSKNKADVIDSDTSTENKKLYKKLTKKKKTK